MDIHYRMVVAYDGRAYHGWQIQRDDRSVEGALTTAAARVLDCAADQLKIQGASRTDAGVHALGQVAHLAYQVDRPRSAWDFARGLNALTDDDICVVYVDPAPAGFHARHRSHGKRYRYQIWNHRFAHPLRLGRAWRVVGELDIDRMRRAADRLIGEHDYAAFRGADCSADTTMRDISRADIRRKGPLVTIEIEGTAFLKYMVRILAGTLVAVGTGRLAPAVIDRMFATGERALGGQTAPPHGLTLMEVFYPDEHWSGDLPAIGGHWLAQEAADPSAD